jgi:RpiR family carbohydrate utilization transcriptional regulator
MFYYITRMHPITANKPRNNRTRVAQAQKRPAIELSRVFSSALSPSEERVAEYVKSAPEAAMQLSIAGLAEAVGVSEPTVARFCQSAGFSGFKDFRLWLARAVGAGTPYVHADVAANDTPTTVLSKVAERTQAAVGQISMQIDPQVLGKAVQLLTNAKRIEFYGQGNSGITAQDGAHKFFRIGIPSVAHADPHVHSVSAAMLSPGDVVVAISNSGRTKDLLDTVEIARDAGASVIAMTAATSPLARQADVVLAVNPSEDPDVYAPMTARIAQLVIIDALAVAVALALGPKLQKRLETYKNILARKRAASKKRSSDS